LDPSVNPDLVQCEIQRRCRENADVHCHGAGLHDPVANRPREKIAGWTVVPSNRHARRPT
jgi:hypothetical protein